MSEYQYYEFQAVDRLLDADARAKLRAISTRARITASSFVNTYNWGDLKADPLQLLERYFDLFLYVANWGTRQFAMKLPARLLDVEALKSYRLDEDLLLVRRAGEHVILSIQQTELDYDDDWYNEEGDEGSGWLGALAPLRAELLAGDLRLFPLLWLIQVRNDWIDDDELEPPPGLGPLSPALAMLADFLCVDGNLLEAASGSPPAQEPSEPSASEVERFLRGLSENEKVGLLARLYRGHDPHLSLELHRRVHAAIATAPVPEASPRTAGELRAAARRMAAERQRLAEEKAAAEQRRREREAEKAREKRLQALAGREDESWQETESLIALRNPPGYERATALLTDLGALADRTGAFEGFAQRLAQLRARHAGKRTFISRLDAAGLPGR
jgi:hypothetical protein